MAWFKINNMDIAAKISVTATSGLNGATVYCIDSAGKSVAYSVSTTAMTWKIRKIGNYTVKDSSGNVVGSFKVSSLTNKINVTLHAWKDFTIQMHPGGNYPAATVTDNITGTSIKYNYEAAVMCGGAVQFIYGGDLGVLYTRQGCYVNGAWRNASTNWQTDSFFQSYFYDWGNTTNRFVIRYQE